MQNVKQGQGNEVRRSEEGCNHESPRQKLPKDNIIRREIEGEAGSIVSSSN